MVSDSARRRRVQIGRVIGVLTATVVVATALPAQGWPVAPTGLPLQAIAERRFDAASGLHATTAFAMALDPRGEPWLAADDGLYRYTKGAWVRASLPAEFANQQVRSLVITADGTKWLGTRRGVLRVSTTGATAIFREADGLPGPVVYSLVESRAIDGQRRIVAGTSRGMAWFDGRRFVPLSLPGPSPWVGVMVAAGEGDDGGAVLWAANSAGGVARYARGSWRAYGRSDGLDAPDAQFILPLADRRATRGSTQDSSTVYVATAAGVFAYDRRADRFDLLAGSPTDVYRVESVPGPDGVPEVWAGTVDGTLHRHLRGRWTPIPSSVSERRGSVSLLRALAGPGDRTVVYASTRNGYVVRLTYGVAAALTLPTRRAAPVVSTLAALPREGGPDKLLVGTQDDGLLEIEPNGATRRHPFAVGTPWGPVSRLTRAVVTPPTRTPGTDTVTLAVARGVPYRQRGGAFERMVAGLDDIVVHELRRVTLPNGTSALLAATSRGVRVWNGQRWEPLAGLDDTPAMSVYEGDERGAPVLYVGGTHEVRVFGRAGLRTEPLPPVGSRSTGVGYVARLCRSGPAADARLFALDTERGVFWRRERASGGWQLFPAISEGMIANQGVTGMECLSDSRLAISSFSGLSLVDVSASDTAAWRVAAQVSDEDGLPAITIGDIRASGQSRYLWVGTPYGVGLVDATRATGTPRFPLSLDVATMAGRPIAEGESLDMVDDDIRLDPQLLTVHREEDTRYLVEVTRTDPWYFGGGRHAIGPDGGELVNEAAPLYHDLGPGQYLVRVTGFDWAGRAYGPITRTFAVRTPLALRWYALAGYLVLVVGGLTALYRFRVRTIRAAGEQLLLSERRVRDSERRFKTLFEQALDAHLLLADGQVQAANDQAAALFGVEAPERLLQRTLAQLFGGDEAPLVDGERRVKRGDLLIPVQCTVSEVPTETVRLQHVVLRDLTAARAAEAEREWFEGQVREAQKLESLGTLAGGVAHDFNNLLGVVRGNAELARAALKRGRTVDDHLAAILDASDRARDVVKQILTFSRRSTPTREFVNLSALIVDLQPLLRRMVPRTVQIVIDGAETPRVLMGDPTQLQQLLLNLVSNADYALRSQNQGLLTIAVSGRTVPASQPAPHGEVVVLRVSDNGDGMSEAVRARIFEPFFTTKPTGEGTGLGMAVVHGIVVSHDGRAEVISAPGEGTTFEMVFPAADLSSLFDDDVGEASDDDATGAAAVAAHAPAVDGGVTDDLVFGRPTPSRGVAVIDDEETSRFAGAQIVVVDDEPSVARVVERALQQYGLVVHTFLTPEPALAFIRTHLSSVDLLITDQTMPGLTGDQLAESVRAMRPDVPVLILTGYSHRLTAARVAAVGARAVLLKPVELDALKRAVDDALEAGQAGTVV